MTPGRTKRFIISGIQKEIGKGEEDSVSRALSSPAQICFINFAEGAVAGMDRTLFVENIPAHFNDRELYELFAPFGAVISTRVVKGHTGVSLRFGFVEMALKEDAVRAKQALHGVALAGQVVLVLFDEKKRRWM